MRIRPETDLDRAQEADAQRQDTRRDIRGGRGDVATAGGQEIAREIAGRARTRFMTHYYYGSLIQTMLATYNMSFYGQEYYSQSDEIRPPQIEQDGWEVWYDSDTDPDAADPVWVETAVGVVYNDTANGIFQMINTGAANELYYYTDISGLDSAKGTKCDTRLRVRSDVAALNQGAVITLYDGARQYTTWFRADGFNIQGSADYPIDMSTWRDIHIEADANVISVWVDDLLLQTGASVGVSALERALFGLRGPAVCWTDWYFIRVDTLRNI